MLGIPSVRLENDRYREEAIAYLTQLAFDHTSILPSDWLYFFDIHCIHTENAGYILYTLRKNKMIVVSRRINASLSQKPT